LGAAPDVTVTRRWFDAPRGIAVLWTAILAGPFAWAVNHQLSYSIVQWVCGGGPKAVLYLISFGSLVICGGGVFAAWTALQWASTGKREDGSHPDERGRFMAVLGLWLCALFALIVIAETIPRAVLDACQQ
jgi:hypothetical protein